MAKNRHQLLTVLRGVMSPSSSSSSSTTLCSRQRSARVRSSYMINLWSLVSYVMILFLFVILSNTVVVDAVGPKYIAPSTQQQQQPQPQSTIQSKRTKHRPTTHPWIIQQRSAVGGTLLQQQQPTTRQFLDQCVSFIDLLEVIMMRGGGDSHGTDPSSSSSYTDDWSNVNNNQYNHPNQYDDRNVNDDIDDDDYNYNSSRNQPSSPQRRNSSTRKDGIIGSNTSFRSLPNVLQKVDRKTGLMLLVSGISLTFLGITLFFNKTIIRLGHLLCIAGILLSMGLSQTIQYFVQPEKLRATICLGIGVFLVFIGSPLFGIVLEVFGILNLFGNMFPIVMIMIKQMPIIGTMLKSTTTTTSNNNNSNRSRRNSNNNDDEYYYSNNSRRQSQQPSSSRNQYDYDNHEEYGHEEDDGLGRRY